MPQTVTDRVNRYPFCARCCGTLLATLLPLEALHLTAGASGKPGARSCSAAITTGGQMCRKRSARVSMPSKLPRPHRAPVSRQRSPWLSHLRFPARFSIERPLRRPPRRNTAPSVGLSRFSRTHNSRAERRLDYPHTCQPVRNPGLGGLSGRPHIGWPTSSEYCDARSSRLRGSRSGWGDTCLAGSRGPCRGGATCGRSCS